MNEHDKQLAERLAGESREAEKNPLSLEGYHEVEYGGETWPLNDDGINALPEEVVYGNREPTKEEALAALKEQGYEVE